MLNKNELLVKQSNRSKRARSLDKRITHQDTRHWSDPKAQKIWVKHPGRLDLTGIDTKHMGGFVFVKRHKREVKKRRGARKARPRLSKPQNVVRPIVKKVKHTVKPQKAKKPTHNKRKIKKDILMEVYASVLSWEDYIGGPADYMDVYIQSGEPDGKEFDGALVTLKKEGLIFEVSKGKYSGKKPQSVSSIQKEYEKLWKEAKKWEKQIKKTVVLKRLKDKKTKMTGVEKIQLETLVNKRATEQGFDPQAIDIYAYIDPKLTYYENKKIIEQHLPTKKPIDMSSSEIREQIDRWEAEKQDLSRLIEERNRAKELVFDAVRNLEKEYRTAKKEEIWRDVRKRGVTLGEVEDFIEEMKRSGDIYEPVDEQYKIAGWP